MAEVAKRLYGPAFLSLSTATVYTVPTSTTTILKSVRVTNNDAAISGNSFTLLLNGTTVATNSLFSSVAVSPSGSFDWSGWIVLNPGDILRAFCTANSIMAMILTGIEVS